MVAAKVVIVTGSNRGIGRAICELLLARSELSAAHLYATSRKGADLKLTGGPGQRVLYKELDVSNSTSISAFVDTIKSVSPSVDILINNAGVNLDNEFSAENARRTLDVNYRGTLSMCRAFLPLMSPGGRIVNLSSVASALNLYSEDKASQMDNIDGFDGLDSLVDQYLAAVDSGDEEGHGFPVQRSYSVSKACVNVLTKVVAKENPGLTVNCCCPGWVNSDMGNLVGKPSKSLEDGARIPVRLAVGDVGDVSGKYWANDSIRSREEGKVQERW